MPIENSFELFTGIIGISKDWRNLLPGLSHPGGSNAKYKGIKKGRPPITGCRPYAFIVSPLIRPHQFQYLPVVTLRYFYKVGATRKFIGQAYETLLGHFCR